MTKMKLKLMCAGVFVGCALGLIALRVAWATPAKDFFATFIAGPVALGPIDIKGETDTHEIEIKTTGVWETRVAEIRIAPGGHTGWHSHPGPVFVMITAGTMTLEQADGSTAVYPA